jgi:hypothetical protein
VQWPATVGSHCVRASAGHGKNGANREEAAALEALDSHLHMLLPASAVVKQALFEFAGACALLVQTELPIISVFARTASRMLAALLPCICLGQQPAPAPHAPTCHQFAGLWTGTFTQGQYGMQRIHVRHVSEQCVGKLAYNPAEGKPETVYEIPIRAGAMEFACSVPGGSCRLEYKDGELLFTFGDPSGFVNTGVFRKER